MRKRIITRWAAWFMAAILALQGSSLALAGEWADDGAYASGMDGEDVFGDGTFSFQEAVDSAEREETLYPEEDLFEDLPADEEDIIPAADAALALEAQNPPQGDGLEAKPASDPEVQEPVLEGESDTWEAFSGQDIDFTSGGSDLTFEPVGLAGALDLSNLTIPVGANNTFNTATAIEAGVSMQDNLATSSDVNMYAFTLASRGYITVSFGHDVLENKGKCWEMTVYDSGKNALAVYYFKGSDTEVATTTTIGLPAGKIFLRVRRSDVFTDTAYILQVNYTASTSWEKESNDTQATGDAVAVNEEIGGAILSTSDVDYFSVAVPSTGCITIYFAHDYVDTSANCWNLEVSDGETLLTTLGFHGNTNGYVAAMNLGVPKDTYYLRVSAGAEFSDAAYRITVGHTETSSWETEFNNSFSAANTRAVNTEINGTLMTSSDYDYFKFTTQEAGKINLSFRHDQVENGSSTWRVTLFDKNQSSMAEYTFLGNTEETVNTAPIGVPAGTFYLRVTQGSAYSGLSYEMKLNFTAASGWETERNDAFSTADVLAVDTTINGNLMQITDNDYYKFKVEADGVFYLNFSHEQVDDAVTYWRVVLYNSGEKLISQFYYAGNGASSTQTQLTLTAGTYYLRVRKGAESTDKNYALELRSTLAPTKIRSIANTGEGIRLAWDAVDGVTYLLYRRAGSGKYKRIKTTTASSYTDKKATDTSVLYRYRVYCRMGSVKSKSSNTKGTYRLATPADVTVTSPAPGQLEASWGEVVMAKGYQVKWTRGSKTGKAVAHTASQVVKGLSKGKKYAVSIRAYRKVGSKTYYSGWSNPVTVKVKKK